MKENIELLLQSQIDAALHENADRWDNVDPLWLALSHQRAKKTSEALRQYSVHNAIGPMPETCQWIDAHAWFAGRADRQMCGGACVPDKPYCATHYRLSTGKK